MLGKAGFGSAKGQGSDGYGRVRCGLVRLTGGDRIGLAR
jgi:hypothetical protein